MDEDIDIEKEIQDSIDEYIDTISERELEKGTSEW